MKLNNERSRDQKLKENEKCTNVMNRRSRVRRSTTFYKDLSNSYLKDVNSQRFDQSHHDIRSWYHGTRASTECLKAHLLHLGSLGACLQAMY